MTTKPALILSFAMLISAVALKSDFLYSLAQRNNILHTTAGKYVMGEIYSEELISSASITPLQGDKIFEASGLTLNLYDDLVRDFKDKLKAVNERKDAKDRMKFEDVSPAKDVEIELTTSVKYRSEFQPASVTVIIDTTTLHYKADEKPFHLIFDDVKGYSKNMLEKYKKENTFIR